MSVSLTPHGMRLAVAEAAELRAILHTIEPDGNAYELPRMDVARAREIAEFLEFALRIAFDIPVDVVGPKKADNTTPELPF
jgi:hypothetical protein